VRVTWVHPSWRDLVVERLADDAGLRCRFLAACGIEGVLVALSVAGGHAGERTLPLLRTDADWDLLADRLGPLLAESEDRDVARVLAALAAAHDADLDDVRRAELATVAARALELVERRWDATGEPIPLWALEEWLALAGRLPASPPPPRLGVTWVELLPPERLDDPSPDDLRRVREWLGLAAILESYDPGELAALGFPERYWARFDAVLEAAGWNQAAELDPERRALLSDVLDALGRVMPPLRARARWVREGLGREPGLDRPGDPPELGPEPQLGAGASWGVQRVLRDL
jgi:hypothetical protein